MSIISESEQAADPHKYHKLQKYAGVREILKPYTDRKPAPEPEVNPWTRWRHKDGREFMICKLKYDSYYLADMKDGDWYHESTDTPIETFGGDFDQFTQVEAEL